MQGFEGTKAGLYFGTGQFGLGYYTDIMARSAAASDDNADGPSGENSRQPSCVGQLTDNCGGQRHEQERDAAQSCHSTTEEVGSSAAGAAEVISKEADRDVIGDGQQHDSTPAAAGQPASAEIVDKDACTTSGAPSEESNVQGGKARSGPAHVQQRPRHYWGQALQYLEKSADVTKGPPHHLHIFENVCYISGSSRKVTWPSLAALLCIHH